MPLANKYITLSEPCSLRLLETPCVYNRVTDELYELGMDGVEFLLKCDGTKRVGEVGGDPEFVAFCFKEGILAALQNPFRRYYSLVEPPAVSLRYLELHVTTRCNLRCRHCYLSAGEGNDLELMKVFKVFDEFDSMHGLRMLLSGGEPLLHKGFWYINERVRDYGFRTVLLTNGSLISKETASRLNVHEAQVSLDGMRASHDALRGNGSFDRALQGMEHLTAAGIKVSAATMVTSLNRHDFNDMRLLVDSLGVEEWTVDAPSMAGRFRENPGLMLSPEEAAPYLSYGTGGGRHGSADGYACGAHLCAVGSHGQVAKCGFYIDRPVGDINDGLRRGWEKIGPVRLDRLSCECAHKDDCRGGCRFRASSYTDEYGPDPVKCYGFGIATPCVKGGGSVEDNEGCENRGQRM